MDTKAQYPYQPQKVAIVGIGCRYGNGINNVKHFWEMLAKGLDCTRPPPPDRFDSSFFLVPGEKRAGKMYNQKGGYLTQDPYMFDRQFFKMPPDEAAHLDPQVRLLLEVTWEAFENAGIPASAVRGSKTGVYMGVTSQEYMAFAGKPLHNMNQYTNSGTNSCMVANRISYEFDLHGPSFSVDTACSSSLYSVYLACEALKQKSCSLALAGGVNLILGPNVSVGFCQAGMLSGDGKCKSFDQAADGYSRSEGAGVLVLKPLDEALRNGDRVYAVLRGGALSNDGRTPGIANPSFAAQVDLVKSTCQNAGIDPREIVYAEAHGTGTRVGDTTEAGALGEAMGRQRGPQDPPLHIGSVKSNLGHSEGAAGVAGVIKVALSLHQRKIPQVVHFQTPNENVDFEALNIRVPTKLTPWPAESRLLACCSSFGFGGANANLVLEGIKPPQMYRSSNANSKDVILSCLLLSAASQHALHQKIKDWVSFLTENPKMNVATFHSCLYTAACRSQHHAYRVGFAVHSREDALRQLQTKLQDDTRVSSRYVEGVASAVASDTTQPIVFVFSGMGTQWWGMARELMHTQPVFLSKIKIIDKLLRNCGAKWSLVSMLTEEKDQHRIHQTDISQPCLFAVAVGLLDLWKMRGVVPDAVVGHSVGEVAAAYAAGLLSLEHAVKLIYRRGRELRKTSGSGKMVAVLHRVEDTLSLAESSRHGQLLDVAAINSPGQVVFSGDSCAVEGLANELKTADVKCVLLKVNNAFHSKQQEVLKSSFLKKVGKFLKIQTAAAKDNTLPMMSTVTGRYLTVEEANSPEYWFQNVRQKVSFMDGIHNLAKDGYRVFVEVGAHSSLLPALHDTFAGFQGAEGKFIMTGSLVRPRDTSSTADDSENLLLSQMRLHVNGVPVEFGRLFDSPFQRVVSIPHYPWQREKCTNVTQEAREEILFPFPADHHFLLGEPTKSFYHRDCPVKIWRADLNASTVPWVKDHVLQGAVIVPAAAYTETGLAAARSLFHGSYPLVLSKVTFDRFMFLSDAEGCLESTVEERTAEQFLFTLRSYDTSKDKWTQHCHLNIIPPSAIGLTGLKTSDETINEGNISEKCQITLSSAEFYSRALECGFRLGPTFKGVQKFLISGDYLEGLLYAEVPPSVQGEFHRYVCHPAFLDSFLQGFLVISEAFEREENKMSGRSMQPLFRVPKSITGIAVSADTPLRTLIYIKVNSSSRTSCDIDVADADSKRIFCSIRGLAFETIQNDRLEPQVLSTSWDNLGPLKSKDRPVNASAPAKKMVVFPDDTEVSASLVRLLKEEDASVSVVDEAEDFAQSIKNTLSENPEPDTFLILLKTGAASIGLNSGAVMSRQEFEMWQERGPLLVSSVYTALQSSSLKPKLLLVTRGAHRTKEGDEIHPFSAILPAVGVTVSHEDPSVRWYNVDLPMTASNRECVQILQEIISRKEYLLHDENCVAVRSASSTGKERGDPSEIAWEFLTPRLKMENVSKAPGVVPTTDWSVGVHRVSDHNRITVQKSGSGALGECKKGTVLVKIEAFTVYTKQKEGRNTTDCLLCVYSGRAEGSKIFRETSDRLLGITYCTEVLPFMSERSDDLTDVPGFLKSEEAVSIVQDYLPSAIFFDKVLSICPGMRLLCKLDCLDDVVLATLHLAAEYGARATILKDGHDDREMESLGLVTSFLNEVSETSIDVLFLSIGSSSLDTTLYSLLSKLKINATLVIMRRQRQEVRLHSLPSKMKMVMFDANLPDAVDGLASADISQMISDLWMMFNPNKSDSHLTCHRRKCKQLSSLAATNSDIPEEDVIKIEARELLLPLSLQKDGLIADDTSAYFVTGGTRGFGLKLLEWLVTRGARYVYTCSRKKMSSELIAVIEQAQKVGAQVEHIQMDVTNTADLERELKRMNDGRQNWPPLKGIFHCAAVFSDVFLHNLTAESWNNVMAPKAYGALLLHQVTLKLGIQLDHFIMTSSIVSLIGNAGQGSYCAANLFLNSLAQYRHNKGLPATAVQIGIIHSAGFAETQGLIQLWEKNGVGSLSPEEVLSSIGCALSTNLPEVGIAGSFNRKVYAERHRGLMEQHFVEKHGTISMLKDLYHDRDVYLTTTNDTFVQSIVALPLAKAQEVVTQTFAKLLGQHLGLSAEVPPDASPISLGLDSLMASEVSQMISQQFEVTVGAMDLLNDSNTIQELAKNITRDMFLKVDLSGANNLQSGELSTEKAAVIKGEVPKLVRLILVCFPSTGAGPSLFAPWVQPLLQYGIQILMIQLPGWEGREDEQLLTDMSDITRLVHTELVAHLRGSPFVFFGHSMGSLIAFEVAHTLLAEDNMSPRHLFVSAWYAPQTPYPHPKELQIKASSFERVRKTLEIQPRNFVDQLKAENISFSFLDKGTLSNTGLMRRLLPGIEAANRIIKAYTCAHETPLPCNVTAFGGKQDAFVSPELLDHWEAQTSNEYTFKKLIYPGKHMFILTNTAEIVKGICLACKKSFTGR